MTKLDDLRSAHVEGTTFAAYVDKAESFLTAGAEGDVRVYPGLYDDETTSVSLGSAITSLAVKDELVVLSNSQNEVTSYSLPDMKIENVLLRFTSPVNHVCISDDKSQIAACSSDFSIKVVLKNGTGQKTLTGHSAPVLSLCFLPNCMLASNSCDGTVRIWNLEDQKCNTVLEILPKYNSVPDFNNVMSICKTSQFLAIPTEQSIKILSTLTFQEEFTLDKEHSKSVTCICWSSCGKYLTSGSSNGEIYCWDTQSKTCIKKNEHHEAKPITCLTWKPNGTEILYADNEGQFGTCEMPMKASKKTDEYGLDDDDDDIMATAVMGDVDEDTNDGAIFPSSAAKKGKKRVMQIDNDGESDGDDDGDYDEGDPNPSKKSRINNMDNFLDDQADEDDEDDEASISLNLIKEGFLEPMNKPVIEEEDDDDLASVTTEKKVVKEIVEIKYFMQPAFQPSSTPVHLQHRFMCWNSIGIIRCRTDDDVSSIDVEFHNASTSHPLHIPNVLDNTMATLSNTAAVFACLSQDDVPSKLTCINFGSWDSNKEWSVSMNEDEDIHAIAVNTTQVSMATSKRMLRIFTVGGLQTQILQLPGPVVSMAMHDKEMVVLYHKSTGLNKSQCLGICYYVCKKMKWRQIKDESFFMQPEMTVVWLGFSTEGTPVIVLSHGEVLLYHREQQTWVEIGNTKKTVKNKSDNYWIIGVEEQLAQLRCIYCKGANFPALLPRPIPTMVPIQLPLCEMKTEKSMKEHDLMKNNLLSSNLSYSERILRLPVQNDGFDRKQIQLLMQLFALACKADRDHRAVEVCKLMPSADAISLAIQYATKMRRMGIAKKLTELAQKKAEEEENEEEEEEEEEQSDDEVEIEENKENHRKFTPISRGRTGSLGLSRNSLSNSQHKKVEEPVEDIEDEEEEEMETESIELKSQVKSSYSSENTTPKLKHGNPFKLSQQDSTQKTAAVKGTGYFETLDSQKLSKTKQAQKTINTAVSKRKTKIPGKSGKIEKSFKTKEKVDFNIGKTVAKTEEPKKKTTGFQLFLENRKANTEESQEDFIPQAMKLWKELGSDEKREWNDKAKQISGEPITNNTNTNNNDNKPEPLAKSETTKSKLSSFAFQKT